MKEFVLDGVTYRQYDHIYSTSYCGKVLRYLEPFDKFRTQHGYFACGKKNLVHRMIATCWIENPDKATFVHHKDHNRQNNSADNLEWLSPKNHAEEHQLGSESPALSTREKLRNARLGTTQSNQTKEKISEGSKQWWKNAKANGYKHDFFKGKQHKTETKEKMSRNSPRNTPCVIYGTEYPSFKAASAALGMRPLTLRKRCLSKNFPDFQIKA